MESKEIIVTGGAGFIGSNMVELLLKDGHSVKVVDNLTSTGDDRFLKPLYNMGDLELMKIDITKKEETSGLEADLIIHFAANSDVRHGFENPEKDFDSNVLGTFNILEAARKNEVGELMFSSSSTVFGVAKVLPTPEEYGPLLPISSYGASKLSNEAMISAYSNYYGIKSTIFRFANIVGKNSTHGVIFDFIKKLVDNPKKLEILGDGTQRKSYLHVSDCVKAMLFSHKKTERFDIYNIANDGTTSVMKIADMVIAEMGIEGVEKVMIKTEDGGGWKGDVKVAELSPAKLYSKGWKNTYSSDEAVKIAIKETIGQLGLRS
ncbi:MAG: NAD-dependent epimerase/dehydratase family protein [Candidatus Parvarchaeum sp.]